MSWWPVHVEYRMVFLKKKEPNRKNPVFCPSKQTRIPNRSSPFAGPGFGPFTDAPFQCPFPSLPTSFARPCPRCNWRFATRSPIGVPGRQTTGTTPQCRWHCRATRLLSVTAKMTARGRNWAMEDAISVLLSPTMSTPMTVAPCS